MPSDVTYLIAFLGYLVFVCLFLWLGNGVDFLKSHVKDMIDAYREAAARGDWLGKLLFGGLLVLRLGFKIAAWGFFIAGFTIVMGICKITKPDFLEDVRAILNGLSNFIRSLNPSASSRHLPPFVPPWSNRLRLGIPRPEI